MKKRIISFLMALGMVFTMLPTVTLASEPTATGTDLPTAEEYLASNPSAEGDPATLTYEQVVALFEALPSADSITAETTDEEKAQINAQVGAAMAAYDALSDEDYARFNSEQFALLQVADALSRALTQGDAATYGEETIWTGVSAQYFAGGTGTADDPYQIATAEQLCLLSAVINQFDYSSTIPERLEDGNRKVVEDQEEQTYDYLSKAHYKLTTDIVLNDTTNWKNWNADTTDLNKWYPIGRKQGVEVSFNGTFEGNNKTVSGMYIDGEKYEKNMGLFGTSEGIIQNVTVEKSCVTSRDNYVGGVLGFNSNGTVKNCTNSGTISGSYYVGGVVGGNYNGTVIDCINSGTVDGNVMGGVVGQNSGTVESCTNSGTVSGTTNVGGVVGNNTTSSILNCENSGTVSGDYDIGGIAGGSNYNYGQPGSITGCHNFGFVSGNYCIGGVAGTSSYQ